MEYESALKRKEILTQATTCINLGVLLLSEMSQSQKDKYCMIPILWGPWSGHWDRRQNDGCQRLRTWDPLLQCLPPGKPLLQQQNTKKLYGTKNNCVHAQLGQILDKKIQKTKKLNCHFWRAASNAGGREQKQGTSNASCTHHHLSHPSGPTPGHTPTLTPY